MVVNGADETQALVRGDSTLLDKGVTAIGGDPLIVNAVNDAGQAFVTLAAGLKVGKAGGAPEAAVEAAVAAENEVGAAWPLNRGFVAGEGARASVLTGQVLDRYGGPGGSFLSPAGTPAAARSLSPGVELRPLNSYQVIKPFEASGGRVAPAFGQPGLGLQFDLGQTTVQDLINSGHLRPMP